MKTRITLFIILGLISLTAFTGYVYYSYQKRSLALTEETTIRKEKVKESWLGKSKRVNKFSFYSTTPDNGFKLGSGVSNLGVAAFAGRNLKYNENNHSQVFLPTNNIKQLVLKKKLTDKVVHYQYQQQINNIPVYGSSFFIHAMANDQIYGVEGNMTSDETLPLVKITEEQAKSIAIKKAQSDTGDIPLFVYQTAKIIINKKILGISEDDQNFLTFSVSIKSELSSPKLFYRKYYVDLDSGKVIYEENLLQKALNRIVFNYQNGKTRVEGQPPVSDSAMNITYDTLGKGYNFFKNTFGIDSYDGRGSKWQAVVHLIDRGCPNAFSLVGEGIMYFCDHMYTEDIIGHEMSHQVIGTRLAPSLVQTGAVTESMADMFSYGIDPSNWTMGEGSALGIFRRYDDPTLIGDPDKLFSPYYYCGKNDDYAVYKNMGVLNKTFYLMMAGGNFNGCLIQGIGASKVQKIFYKALVAYIASTANFRDIYDAVNHACNDLYGAESADCINAKKAMEATEVDQQPAGTQTGPKCSGVAPKTASCVGTTGPTATPIPGVTTTITPATPTPTVPPQPTVPITPTGNVKINLKLKFQGINTKPDDSINRFYVKLTLVSDSDEKYQSYGAFAADESGVFSGSAFFNISQAKLISKYKILVKGPMHLQKRICDPTPTETTYGYYHCSIPALTITSGINSFDFSGITLFAGDLPPQDGIINAYDLSLIRQRLGVGAQGPQLYDINLDGKVDTQDYSLIIYALSTRFDD